MQVRELHVTASSPPMLQPVSVLTCLPRPNVLGIVTASAAPCHNQLIIRAQSRAVLLATLLGLIPRRGV